MPQCRCIPIAALVAAALLLPASPAIADGCPDATLPLATATPPCVDAAIACLVKERSARGRRPLALDTAVRNAARAHSRADGYKGGVVGENIAGDANTAAGAMRIWMGSAGHRGNILSASYNVLGVGAIAKIGKARTEGDGVRLQRAAARSGIRPRRRARLHALRAAAPHDGSDAAPSRRDARQPRRPRLQRTSPPSASPSTTRSSPSSPARSADEPT